MNLTIDVNINWPPEIVSLLAQIASGIAKLQLGQEKLMAEQDDLKTALAAEDLEIDQALALIAREGTDIATLQTELAAAIALSAPDLSPLIAGVQAKTLQMLAALPPPAPPGP
jgi:hypothetical protein